MVFAGLTVIVLAVVVIVRFDVLLIVELNNSSIVLLKTFSMVPFMVELNRSSIVPLIVELKVFSMVPFMVEFNR